LRSINYLQGYDKKRKMKYTNSPVFVFLVPKGTQGGGAPSPINVRTCLPIN
jgi:hypothetical protein